jgi:cytoskeleton protein RodZ
MSRVPKNVPRRERAPTRNIDVAPLAEAPVAGEGAAGARRPNRQPPPWEKEAVSTESGSFGDWLRRQREVREIGIRDIADRTKISLRYLEAMEADRFDLLPAPVFAKGFLREYARYVGLSPDDVVNHYLSVHHPEELAAPIEDPKVRPRQKPGDVSPSPVRRNWSWSLLLALAGLVLLLLVGLFAYLSDRHHEEKKANARQTAPAGPGGAGAPVAALPAAPAPQAGPPASPIEVSLDFSNECWVDAVIDGKNHRSEIRVQGEALQLEAQKSIVLTLGNAGAVEVQVNGYPLELHKKDGEVAKNLTIDLDTVQALKAKKEAR